MQEDFNEINMIIKEYWKSLDDCKDPNQVSSIKKLLETFEREEKEKSGKQILAPYSDFQINKVPSKPQDLNTKFPKLYKLFYE